MQKILLYVLALGCLCSALPPIPEGIDEWWRTAVIYQIYPRSFKDSDNDGDGDLPGVISRLSHVTDLGANAFWLSPIYPSPMIDSGYDISDFVGINPLFGTEEDFDNLVAEANAQNLKVILDFVPNHSSDLHEWFALSVNREPGYEDYYVWRDCLREEDVTIPPNNWESVFGGSAWEWNEQRQQCYLHQFAIQQPDLNYRDPGLVEDMKNVLRYWLDKGVYGFRVDAIAHLFEDDEFLDEPYDDDGNLIHIYTKNQNGTFDMVYQWRALLDEYAAQDNISRFMAVEAYESNDVLARLYGNDTQRGASFPFNFALLTDLNYDSNGIDFYNAVNRIFEYLPEGETPNWVTGNHDNHRVATRQGNDRIGLFNELVLGLPGTAITYNGEEFGQADGYVSWEDTQDPQALNAGPDRYLDVTRDPERTPLQWDDTVNAGFNEGGRTWLPVSSDYVYTNLAEEETRDNSYYANYQQSQSNRLADWWRYGEYEIELVDEENFYIIYLYDNVNYLWWFSTSRDTTSTLNLKKVEKVRENVTVLKSRSPNYYAGQVLSANEITLGPSESILLEL